MIETLIQKLAEWGIVGVLLGLSLIFIWTQKKDHRSERDEWREEAKNQWDQLAEISKETQSVMREHTSVLSELKGIIRTINNK